MKALLWVSIAAILYLTFAWPFAHSADPADAVFKPAAIAVFAIFFVCLAAIIVGKACKAPRT
jgi:polyferredoxin